MSLLYKYHIEEGNWGSLFFVACAKGNLETVKFFVELGFDVNETIFPRRICEKMYRPQTGFEFACTEGHLQIVKFFLENGFNSENLKERATDIFELATWSKNLLLVQYLMSSVFWEWHCLHCECIQVNKFDALLTDVQIGDYDMVNFLLNSGANINALDKYDGSLFRNACVKDTDDVEYIKWLIKKGSDINLSNKYGKTGFLYACAAGNSKIVKLLLENGVDINQIDDDNKNGVLMACNLEYGINKHLLETIQHLLEKGCDANLICELWDDESAYVVEQTGLDRLIQELRIHRSGLTQYNANTIRLCILTIIEHGGQVRDNLFDDVFRNQMIEITFMHSDIVFKNRMIEITFMREYIFQTFDGIVAQTITDFTMLPITKTSLQYISNQIPEIEHEIEIFA